MKKKKGRHTGIEKENKILIVCSQNVFESTFHFLLIYPKYKEIRNLLSKFINP